MKCAAAPTVLIRDFTPGADAEWLHALWHRTLHPRWALSKEILLSILCNAAFLLVAECEGLPCGICVINPKQGGVAGLILLLVESAKQRHGIGTSLVHEAERRLRTQGVHRLTLGAGDGDYFWPGLPHEQEGAIPFFAALGFAEEESSEDLIQELTGFQTPGWVSERIADFGTTFQVAEPSKTEEILNFERRYFPAWSGFFENVMKQGGYSNILLALGPGGEVLGTTLLKQAEGILWREVQGSRVGTLNTLGVASEWQGKGVGLALTAAAMEHLKRVGCSHCLIQWTGLNKWYGKLGAKQWAQYRMLSKIF